MGRVIKFILSVALSFSAGAIGGLATASNIPTWYAALEKPFFNPPNWVFGPVWSVLYLLIGISLYFIWTASAKKKKPKQKAYAYFGIQLGLNVLWSLAFFGLHQPWLAVAVIVALLIFIALTMKEFGRYSRAAKLLLVPYLAWVCFATALNIGVALLN